MGADLPHIGFALAGAAGALLVDAPDVDTTAGAVVAVDNLGREGLTGGFAGGARSRREEKVDAAFLSGAGGTTERWLAVEAPLSTLEAGRLGPSVSFFGAGGGGGGIGIRLGPVDGRVCELDASADFAAVVICTRRGAPEVVVVVVVSEAVLLCARKGGIGRFVSWTAAVLVVDGAAVVRVGGKVVGLSGAVLVVSGATLDGWVGRTGTYGAVVATGAGSFLLTLVKVVDGLRRWLPAVAVENVEEETVLEWRVVKEEGPADGLDLTSCLGLILLRRFELDFSVLTVVGLTSRYFLVVGLNGAVKLSFGLA